MGAETPCGLGCVAQRRAARYTGRAPALTSPLRPIPPHLRPLRRTGASIVPAGGHRIAPIPPAKSIPPESTASVVETRDRNRYAHLAPAAPRAECGAAAQ